MTNKYQIKEEYAYLLMTDEDVIKAVEKLLVNLK
jgi:hypothetical protein